MMSAMSPLTYDALMCKLDNVKSSYELCEVLMQIVSNFAEMVSKMVESQANRGGEGCCSCCWQGV